MVRSLLRQLVTDNCTKVIVDRCYLFHFLDQYWRYVSFLSAQRLGSSTNPPVSGEKMMERISASHTKQISGRAGRFNTQFEAGFVTTLEPKDLEYLDEMMKAEIEPISQVGLNPTADQIELFAFHLPGGKHDFAGSN